MSSKFVKILLAVGAFLLLLLLSGAILLYVSLNRWLAGEDCRALLSNLLSKELQIEGSFQPFQWSGFSVYSEGFQGTGKAGGSVRSIRAEQIRAELNFSALLRGTWEVSQVTVARLNADLGETQSATDAPAPSPPVPEKVTTISVPFLPKDFVLKEVHIMEVGLTWPGDANQKGSLSGTKIDVASEGRDWKFTGTGGKFLQPGLPELKVENYNARFKPPQYLFVDFNLRDAGAGTMAGRGQVDFGKGGNLELEVDLKKVDLAPFLTEDWRAKISAKVNGPVELKSELGKKDGMKAKGALKLTEAKVEALPVLNQIAMLTQTKEFRSIKLQTAQADFEWEKDRIVLNNILLESELLLKVTGNYQQISGNVDGLLQVGTTPEALRFIPGAKEKVFTESKEGYVWTPVKLSGTAADTKEDLTARLKDAAVGAVIEKAGEIQEKVQQGVNSFLDLLNK